METRRLGKTNHQSSVITFGTYAIGWATQDTADRAIEYALAQGINDFDLAPSYGEAELRLGDYLRRHPQPDLFISCKTNERSAAGAREELHRTLDRLGRDRFDLYQLHSVGDLATLDEVMAPGGAFDAILEARDQGLVPFIGITGHGPEAPATHTEALRRYDFATVMTSCNLLLDAIPAFHRDWQALLTACQAGDVGIHVIKAAAKAPWAGRAPTHQTWYEPFTDQANVDRAVAWALNQPVTTLCSSGDLAILPLMVSAAERYQEISAAEQERLLATAPDYANIFEPAPA